MELRCHADRHAYSHTNRDSYRHADIYSHAHIDSNGHTNTGAVGLGEPPSVAAPAAVANAVYHALGVPVRHLPITPDKVLQALGQRKGG